MEVANTIALTLGASWASGLKLYAAILTLGVLGVTGNIILPESLQILTNPWVIGLAGFMYLVEFIADKIPVFDSMWDTAHTFIRIPAGAVLAACAIGQVDPVMLTMAVLAGGLASTGSHGAKMSTRLAINTSPEPFTNWFASLVEDITVVLGLYTAVHYPILFLVLLTIFFVIVIWFVPKIFRIIKGIFIRIRNRGTGLTY